jgi:pSer/pThr/pTyr-binding forkhead associated (FHA) protein
MENGEKGEAFDLRAETIIGRVQGDITFAHDGFMSGRHARIVQDGDDFVLHDEGSRNGVFVRIKKEVRLEPGDYILIGRQLFQFET